MPGSKVTIASSKNAEVVLDGHMLTIRSDLSQTHGESSSGKTTTIASCNGMLGRSGVRVGYNIYKKLDAKIPEGSFASWEPPNDKMRNVEVELQDEKIFIARIDLSQEPEESKSSGNYLFATTSGNRKVGKSPVSFGINISMNKSKKLDLSAVGVDNEGLNFKILPHKTQASQRIIEVDATKAPVTGKSGKLQLAVSDGGAVFFEGLSWNVVVIVPSESFELGKQSEPVEINSKARNITYTHDGKKLRFYVDTSKDFGESSTGSTTIIASGSGKIDGSTVSVSINVYRKIEGRKAPPAEKNKSNKKGDPSYALVKKEVAKHLASVGDDDVGTVGDVRRALIKKHGWTESDGLKAFVKQAIGEVWDEQEDEDGEEEDNTANDESEPPKKKSKK